MTSVSDIDKIFDEGMLTEDEYLQVENNYIRAIDFILEETKSDYLKIVGLNQFESEIEKSPKVQYSMEDSNVYKMAVDGGILSKDQALTLSKLILRENIWCYLVNKKVVFKFGYDFYLDVVLAERLECFNKIEKELNLHIEKLD